MRRHLTILIILTLLVQGILFISYPIGGRDDDAIATEYMTGELLNGNPFVANLGYPAGYALVMAPLKGITRHLGRLEDRALLLLHTVLASLIPFMLYDILRVRRSEREAFIVALAVALDPFGFQWEHLETSLWFIAFCIVSALWLIHRGLQSLRWRLVYIAGAGVFVGITTMCRVDLTVVVAALGMSFFALRTLSWRTRAILFATLGVISAGVLALYLVFFQYPSTHALVLSCSNGINWLDSLDEKQIDLTAQTGPATAHYLDLLTLPPMRESFFVGDQKYAYWRIPGPWVSQAEHDAFLAQPFGTPAPRVTVRQPATLIQYLGPCPMDQMLRSVAFEGIRAHPIHYAIGVVWSLGARLTQIDSLVLPRDDSLTFDSSGGSLSDSLGFRKASGGFYTGQTVWMPGIWLFSHIYRLWNLYKLITPLAVIWALFFSRDWFYATSALLMLVHFGALAILESAQARVYGSIYPLSAVVIGGWIAYLLLWARQRRATA